MKHELHRLLWPHHLRRRQQSNCNRSRRDDQAGWKARITRGAPALGYAENAIILNRRHDRVTITKTENHVIHRSNPSTTTSGSKKFLVTQVLWITWLKMVENLSIKI